MKYNKNVNTILMIISKKFISIENIKPKIEALTELANKTKYNKYGVTHDKTCNVG